MNKPHYRQYCLPVSQIKKTKKTHFVLCWTYEDLSNKESMCAFLDFTVVHCEKLSGFYCRAKVINVTLSRNWQTWTKKRINCALQSKSIWYSKKSASLFETEIQKLIFFFFFPVIYREDPLCNPPIDAKALHRLSAILYSNTCVRTHTHTHTNCWGRLPVAKLHLKNVLNEVLCCTCLSHLV